MPGSTARSFADAACGAVERAHADHNGSTAGFLAMPGPVRVVKLMEYLSSCVWPALLNQWRAGDHNLLSDAHDLFAYNECRGIGAIAERALLGNSTRARAVLRQLQPLHGVLDGCSDTTVVVSALRALCSSSDEAPPSPPTSEVGDIEELASAFAELQHPFKRAEGDEAHPCMG